MSARDLFHPVDGVPEWEIEVLTEMWNDERREERMRARAKGVNV